MIHILLRLIAPLLNAFSNAARGAGKYSRGWFAGGFGLSCGLIANDPYVAIYYTGAIWLCWAPKWGPYFMAIHGEDKRHEKGFPPAQWVLAQIESIKPLNNYLYGVIGFSIRMVVMGVLMPVPMFIAGAEWRGFLMIGVLALAGPVYYLAGRVLPQRAVRLAEFVMGALVMVPIVI